ncbi:MAG TPA: imelysin family protein, partial [Solirubrobacterales bacterium]|nr:imelysin family protein [Solirubrobacterales bacterium]
MTVPKVPTRLAASLCAIAGASLLAAGCGSDDSGDETTAASSSSELPAVKDYLTAHADGLVEQVDVLAANAEEYYALAEAADFDYEALMKESCDEVSALLSESQDAFVEANPQYEEMEGIVAGVPRLAQYDVDIDAGADASDPENAVSFNLELPDGETMKQPGNLFFLTETALYGTNPDLLADVKQDADCDGKVEFGEGIPDANIYVATLREFQRQADALQADAAAFEPTPSDALTAITIMTPTMSEYFEAWKNSRFIAGEDAEEQGFVATSRLSDIADILEGIAFTYAEIEPMIAAEDPQQAKQTQAQLAELLAFVEDLRDREESG